MIPYGRQSLDASDEEAVLRVLRSDWLTTGPAVADFEAQLASQVGVRHGVAVSNGTAALHCAMAAIGVGPGDEVIVPAMTFVATANAVLMQGGTPVFADVGAGDLLLDPVSVAQRITARTKAVVGVDYAGQPCDYRALRTVCGPDHHLLADACHSLGGQRDAQPVGSLADISLFSFHPVKPITCGEGGALVTDSDEIERRARSFRNHGLSADAAERQRQGTWRYQMLSLGMNYRLTDIQCALAGSQLKRLGAFIARRREIACRYDAAFAGLDGVAPLVGNPREHAYHLYVIRVAGDRDAWHRRLHELGIGVNVHYMPVHLHPYYRERLGTSEGLCPVAEAAYQRILSLPIYPAMSDAQVEDVIAALCRVDAESR